MYIYLMNGIIDVDDSKQKTKKKLCKKTTVYG